MTTCLGRWARTDAYLYFATNAEKGLRQVNIIALKLPS